MFGLRQPVAKVVGDSHAIYCFAVIREMQIRFLSLMTMHRVGRDGILSVLPPGFRLLTGDRVIFSFGEIDCRSHVSRIASLKGVDVEVVLDDLVERYLATLRPLAENLRLRVWISCVIPPSRKYMDRTAVLEQVSIRRSLNNKLVKRCSAVGFGFLDFYDLFAAPDGALLPEMDIDGYHVDPRKAVLALPIVSAGLGVPLTARRIWGEVKRYGGHMSAMRRIRKLASDPVRRVIAIASQGLADRLKKSR